MQKIELLGIPVSNVSRKDILEHIKKNSESSDTMFHIVSLNPENAVIASQNKEFKRVFTTAQIVIPDGVGVVAAVQMIKGIKMDQITGVDLMEDLIKLADRMSSTVLLIGGQAKLANTLAECYSRTYARANFIGLEGVKDIQNPQENEEKQIFDIVADRRPRFVFAAFGSPAQELWFWQNRKRFRGCICMGVGGAFDYQIGLVPRAPRFVRRLGFEWLYRLIRQPWRLKRQRRLLTFLRLVFGELRRARLANTVVEKNAS